MLLGVLAVASAEVLGRVKKAYLLQRYRLPLDTTWRAPGPQGLQGLQGKRENAQKRAKLKGRISGQRGVLDLAGEEDGEVGEGWRSRRRPRIFPVLDPKFAKQSNLFRVLLSRILTRQLESCSMIGSAVGSPTSQPLLRTCSANAVLAFFSFSGRHRRKGQRSLRRLKKQV